MENRESIMNNPVDFSGKLALVTGAASGMGLATAEAGAAVVLADFKEDAVKAAAEKLVATRQKALAVRCDVSDDAQVAAMVDRTVAEFGRLDAAFNNAGVMARIAPTAESTREDWERVLGINLRGVWSCMKHELRQMQRQGSGAFVNNASVGALTGNPGIAPQRKDSFMEIKRVGSQASTKGPADWFTGTVRIDPLFQATASARTSGALVTFEPGARTAWHTHPLGQTLIVTSGCGWVQSKGGPVQEVHPGDVVWFPPGEKHWHGATPTTAMTHIAIQEALDGKAVDWMEKVSDEQYRK